jgi:hypothetical protein
MVFDGNNQHAVDIRGWGRLLYMENGALIQDAFGELVADLLNEKFKTI